MVNECVSVGTLDFKVRLNEEEGFAYRGAVRRGKYSYNECDRWVAEHFVMFATI